MTERITRAQYRIAVGLEADLSNTKSARKSKYNNVRHKDENGKVEADSSKEGWRLKQLRQMEQQGVIRNLRAGTDKVRYPLEINGIKICQYEPDAVYEEFDALHGGEWQLVVEDTKSVITKNIGVYRLKKKLMAALFGIEIREIL